MNFNLPPVVKNLLIINVLFFLAKFQLGADFSKMMALHFWESQDLRPWQFVTHMFMHANTMHLLVNMFGLFMFGPHIERYWGSKRFLSYYMFCGLGAAFCQLMWNYYDFSTALAMVENPDGVLALVKTEGRDLLLESRNYVDSGWAKLNHAVNTPMVGASGAIFGILLAFGVLYPNIEMMLLFLPIPIKAKYFVALYALYELSMGVANRPGDSVAHYAHLGGMLFGLILILIWRKKGTDSFYQRWD